MEMKSFRISARELTEMMMCTYVICLERLLPAVITTLHFHWKNIWSHHVRFVWLYTTSPPLQLVFNTALFI